MVQGLTVFMKWKALELQTMPGLIEKVSLVREDLSKTKEKKYGLSAVKKFVL